MSKKLLIFLFEFISSSISPVILLIAFFLASFSQRLSEGMGEIIK